MTDAFRCNGCDEYYDATFRFVRVEMDIDAAVARVDTTLDDIPTEAFGLCEGTLGGGDEHVGDFCIDCGLDALDELIAEFEGGEQTDG
jgi:hypothetical protein